MTDHRTILRSMLAVCVSLLTGLHSFPAIGRVRDMDVWIFHGERDTGVPLGGALNMYEELKALGTDVRLTVFPDVGHGAVNPAMATDELRDWLRAQER